MTLYTEVARIVTVVDAPFVLVTSFVDSSPGDLFAGCCPRLQEASVSDDDRRV